MQSRSLVRRLVSAGSACSLVVLGAASWVSAHEDDDATLQSSVSGAEAACGPGAEQAQAAGALVRVTLESRVGVLLDEIPRAQRAAAASYYLSRPKQFWRERAVLQAKHTNYRLTYRHLFYEGSEPAKGMMAMPPQDLWRIELKPGGAKRVNDGGHDAIVVGYTLESTLLSDIDSPAKADVALAQIGGVWEEPFNFPLDPELVFQRTGYACVDEDGYPLRTADSENSHQLFDQDCDVETPDEPGCHYTEYPDESCKRALSRHTGRVDTRLRFERIRYDRRTADQVRVAEYTSQSYPDLQVIPENLENNRIVYRYIEPDSCAVEEACVTGSGWRRLLMYDASIKNSSLIDLTVGAVDDSSPFVEHNVFEFSACHEHYHYSHYGDFRYGALPGDKRAFCIESTDRYFNSEQTPLTHPYGCENQGIASGWGDTYIAGVECNWIDITNLDVPRRGTRQVLEFRLNPDGFICEGEPVLDANGEQAFAPTDEIGENGEPVDRPLCDFGPGYADDNLGQRSVAVPRDGGFITQACSREQSGPLRDCGFEERAENLTCRPGRSVKLKCKTAEGDPAQVLRVCENSAALGGVTACMYREALASSIIGPSWTNVDFTCPEARGPGEPGGTYGYYTAGLLATDASRAISCQVR